MLVINHSVQDYDELYDLYVQIISKDGAPETLTAQEVKKYEIDNGMAFLEQRSGTENVFNSIDLDNFQPGEYLVYLVAQDHSSAGGTRDGFFSEVLQFLVTKPSPSTT